MRKILSASLSVLMIAAAVSFSSCKKKCTINKEDTASGAIISEKNDQPIIIYPSGGYQLSNMGGDYHIHDGSQYYDRYEVSFDGGKTRGPIDYSQYNILGYQIDATCEASFDRSVTIDNVAQTITYTIVATTCKNCDESYRTENYVLIPAVPETYSVIYDVTINEVE